VDSVERRSVQFGSQFGRLVGGSERPKPLNSSGLPSVIGSAVLRSASKSPPLVPTFASLQSSAFVRKSIC